MCAAIAPKGMRVEIARTLERNVPGGIINRDVLKRVLWEWNDASIDAALLAVGAGRDGNIRTDDFIEALFAEVSREGLCNDSQQRPTVSNQLSDDRTVLGAACDARQTNATHGSISSEIALSANGAAASVMSSDLPQILSDLRTFRIEVRKHMVKQEQQLSELHDMFSELRAELRAQNHTRLPPCQPAWDQEAAMEALGALLDNVTKIDEKAASFWHEHAEVDADGMAGLSLEKTQGMSFKLAQCLKVPQMILADLEWNLFPRFDFNGDGLLSKKEFQKMCRCMIRQRWVEYGGQLENVPIPEVDIESKGYELGSRLGTGGQGSMYLATRIGTSKQVCIKCYHKRDSNTGGLKAIIDEFRLMGELNNRHVAKTYEIFQDTSYYYLVNEPYFGGDLTKLVRHGSERGVQMSEHWWRNIFQQLLTGLEYLHHHAVTHCDIKESNIMIANADSYRAPRAVLIDFGLAQPFSAVMGGICGTPGYIPPETYQARYGNHWFPHGDVFSLGIVFFQLLSGEISYDSDWEPILVQGATTMEEYAELALQKDLPWRHFPAMVLLRDLLDQMTRRIFTSRLRVPQCLDHEWFSCGSDEPWPSDKSSRPRSPIVWTHMMHCPQADANSEVTMATAQARTEATMAPS